LALGAAIGVAGWASRATALVTTPVGGTAGSVDVNVGVTLERGKVEPNENQDSWQAAQWQLYTVGAGYTVGDVGLFKDLFFRIEYTFYDAPAEIIEVPLAPGAVCPVTVAAGCEIHPADQGSLISPQLGFNFVHQGNYSFGAFLKGTIPIDVNEEKFVVPRLDLLGGGLGGGVRFLPWFYMQSSLFVGSGPASGLQNATVALVHYFGFEGKDWLPTGDVGIRLGPYFDGDLTERFDARYDAAFYSGVPSSPGATPVVPADTVDRVRMMRFGVSAAAYVQLTKFLLVEGGFTQKIFGYDTPATQFITFGARGAF